MLSMKCVTTGINLKEFHFGSIDFLPQEFDKTDDGCVIVAKKNLGRNSFFIFEFKKLYLTLT